MTRDRKLTLCLPNSDPNSSQSKKGSSSLIFSETDASSSFAGSGSLTQSGMGFLFLTPDKLSRLADNLKEGNEFQLRQEALGQLAQVINWRII